MPSSPFFSRYSNFQQDPLAPLLEEFERLSLFMHWQPGSENYKNKRKQCIVNEVDTQFSSRSPATLQGWQALLVELAIEPVPHTITQCKKALRGIWINLIDLLDARRSGSGCPRKFASKKELRKYTLNSGKICPKAVAKRDGFIKALLIDIF